MKKLLEWKPVRFGLEVGELYFSKRVSRSAAELAYFLILTFFPVLICINAFIGLLHLDINAVLEAASTFLPRETLGILGDYIQYITGNQSPALLAAGGIMTLFSASAAFRALMNIMEDRSIGADNQVLDSEVPVRQILEQLVARTGIPPFLLGLSWSSTERMSTQQADMMTSELTAIRRGLEPVVERICELWLALHGFDRRVTVDWEDINLQDRS